MTHPDDSDDVTVFEFLSRDGTHHAISTNHLLHTLHGHYVTPAGRHTGGKMTKIRLMILLHIRGSQHSTRDGVPQSVPSDGAHVASILHNGGCLLISVSNGSELDRNEVLGKYSKYSLNEEGYTQ